ncbi:hypothetical protein [Pectobacterium brasiliense]|nr:hypothetical protein [Pectobacterium brasiliense]
MRMLVENDFYFNAKENVGTDGLGDIRHANTQYPTSMVLTGGAFN